MGSSVSSLTPKVIYLAINGGVHKILITSFSTDYEVRLLIWDLANAERGSKVTITDANGTFIPCSGSMPPNSPNFPYVVTIMEPPVPSDISLMGRLFETMMKQLGDTLKLSDLKSEINERFKSLEAKISVDNAKLAELDNFRRELFEIRGQLWERKSSNYRKVQSEEKLHPGFERVDSDGIKIVQPQDLPLFEKYTLTQSTIEYLKKPTFDIWNWEPNEMLALLEHMYSELGLFEEFNINPITMKRWLQNMSMAYHIPHVQGLVPVKWAKRDGVYETYPQISACTVLPVKAADSLLIARTQPYGSLNLTSKVLPAIKELVGLTNSSSTVETSGTYGTFCGFGVFTLEQHAQIPEAFS
ncbi:unnamed protein product [Calicophoron daubneyi]|uniref:Uncharacterized protein n=1 Tax=Calicophoron daubneyi TaxID=300641 RepID=A0AAV2TWV0_CALDB